MPAIAIDGRQGDWKNSADRGASKSKQFQTLSPASTYEQGFLFAPARMVLVTLSISSWYSAKHVGRSDAGFARIIRRM
jgi:hypothetical protein